jgi:uncharacterized secreted protein with C-terminal beta-propeller domain
MRTQLVSGLPLVLAAAMLSTGCDRRDPEFALVQFKSCEALEKEIKAQAEEEVRWAYSWGGGGWGFSQDYAVMESDGAEAPMASDDGGGSVGNRSYSDTNNQVSGVDEADLVETDGTYIYVLAGDSLVINKAWPVEEAAQLARVQLEGNAEGMFLLPDEDLVVTVTQLYWSQPNPLSGGASDRVSQNGPVVKTTLIDVSDPSNPLIQREAYTQGQLHDSRVVDDRLYVVSYSTLGINRQEYYDEKGAALDAIEASSLDDWLPGRFDNLRNGAAETAWASADEDVSRCENTWASERQSGNYMVNVESLELTSPDSDFTGTSVLGSLDAIYANAEHLYVVGSEAADGPWQSFDSSIETIVHRFDIADAPENPSYMASGAVDGWVLNQFAMDEWDDHLRIATTSADPEDGDTSAGLYVMEQSGGSLDVVGQIDGLAEGEQIFAVRMVDDVGYVVTFEQIDPLFTFDLSDHNNPVALGELEVTGFSNYIHPMDDQYLLAVGMEADEDGWQSNLQVSMFDVSDLSEPRLASRLQLDASWSESQSDHHAFNYFAPAETLMLPASHDSSGSQMFVIEAIPGEELIERGSITQAEVAAETDVDVDTLSWCASFRRSVIIENVGYAISNAGITMMDVDEPDDSLGHITFSGVDVCGGQDYYYYW